MIKQLIELKKPIQAVYYDRSGKTDFERFATAPVQYAAIDMEDLPRFLEVDESGEFVFPDETSNFIGFHFGEGQINFFEWNDRARAVLPDLDEEPNKP